MAKACCCFADQFKKCFRHRQCDESIKPLSHLCRAGKVKICKLTGDRSLCARMAAMGLYPGTEAELLCPENSSQCILKIHGGTICLDRAFSENILVSGS
jgi:ferrous iron transport protein A